MLAHVPNPCALNQIGDQRVKLPEAERDAGAKCDWVAGTRVGVKEVHLPAPDRLDFHGGIDPDHARAHSVQQLSEALLPSGPASNRH